MEPIRYHVLHWFLHFYFFPHVQIVFTAHSSNNFDQSFFLIVIGSTTFGISTSISSLIITVCNLVLFSSPTLCLLFLIPFHLLFSYITFSWTSCHLVKYWVELKALSELWGQGWQDAAVLRNSVRTGMELWGVPKRRLRQEGVGITL